MSVQTRLACSRKRWSWTTRYADIEGCQRAINLVLWSPQFCSTRLNSDGWINLGKIWTPWRESQVHCGQRQACRRKKQASSSKSVGHMSYAYMCMHRTCMVIRDHLPCIHRPIRLHNGIVLIIRLIDHHAIQDWDRWRPLEKPTMINQCSSYAIADDYWTARTDNHKITILLPHCQYWYD